MLRRDQISTLPLSEEMSIEEGTEVLFNKLRVLDCLQRDRFLDMIAEVFDQEILSAKLNQLSNPLISREELLNFIRAEPPCSLEDITRINARFALKDDFGLTDRVSTEEVESDAVQYSIQEESSSKEESEGIDSAEEAKGSQELTELRDELMLMGEEIEKLEEKLTERLAKRQSQDGKKSEETSHEQFSATSNQITKETDELKKIIENLTQERDALLQEVKGYEEDEEQIGREVENHRRTLEEMQRYIAGFKHEHEERVALVEGEKLALSNELEATQHELRKAQAAFAQQQGQIQRMSTYIQQLEFERGSLIRSYEMLGVAKGQPTQVFELLDGALEVTFTTEEVQAMSFEQKFEEMLNIVREYRSIKEDYHAVNTERDYLQVTLDSVTNKLRAQQTEIDFLNRQIGVLRNEVAEFIKLEDIGNIEKIKGENLKLKQEIESLRTAKEKLTRELEEGSANTAQLKKTNDDLSRNVAELQELKDKLLKDSNEMSKQLNAAVAENETLKKQNSQLNAQKEETIRMLDIEREEVKRRGASLIELRQKLEQVSSDLEKSKLLLEHEREEAQKKENNLNAVIQQVSLLIQKNEQANESLLAEKEQVLKLEEAVGQEKKKVSQLLEQVENLKSKLKDEKQRKWEQDRVIADLQRELNYPRKESEKTRLWSESAKSYRETLSQVDSVANEINILMKQITKGSTMDQEDVIAALKKEFSALLDQNKLLSGIIEELRHELNKTVNGEENPLKKLKELDLAVPEKLFELTKPADQIEFLARELDKSEKERRKLAASLEAQKDDSQAKEYVISSLKNQSIALLQAQELVRKLREEIMTQDTDKKDAVKKIQALKAYFSKSNRADAWFNRDFNAPEQELIRKKDEQLLELHKRIQKLLGELQRKGYDLHKEIAPEPKGENSANQLNQMMEMMNQLVVKNSEQSSLQGAQLEDENQRLRDKLQRYAMKFSEMADMVKSRIEENKSSRAANAKKMTSCIENLEIELKLLKAGTGVIDQGKLSDFLSKILKNMMSAEKDFSKQSEKESQLQKELKRLVKEAGKIERERLETVNPLSDIDDEDEDEDAQLETTEEEDSIEEDDNDPRDVKKKDKIVKPPANSDDETDITEAQAGPANRVLKKQEKNKRAEVPESSNFLVSTEQKHLYRPLQQQETYPPRHASQPQLINHSGYFPQLSPVAQSLNPTPIPFDTMPALNSQFVSPLSSNRDFSDLRRSQPYFGTNGTNEAYNIYSPAYGFTAKSPSMKEMNPLTRKLSLQETYDLYSRAQFPNNEGNIAQGGRNLFNALSPVQRHKTDRFPQSSTQSFSKGFAKRDHFSRNESAVCSGDEMLEGETTYSRCKTLGCEQENEDNIGIYFPQGYKGNFLLLIVFA